MFCQFNVSQSSNSSQRERQNGDVLAFNVNISCQRDTEVTRIEGIVGSYGPWMRCKMLLVGEVSLDERKWNCSMRKYCEQICAFEYDTQRNHTHFITNSHKSPYMLSKSLIHPPQVIVAYIPWPCTSFMMPWCYVIT